MIPEHHMPRMNKWPFFNNSILFISWIRWRNHVMPIEGAGVLGCYSAFRLHPPPKKDQVYDFKVVVRMLGPLESYNNRPFFLWKWDLSITFLHSALFPFPNQKKCWSNMRRIRSQIGRSYHSTTVTISRSVRS